MLSTQDLPEFIRKEYPFQAQNHELEGGFKMSYLDEGDKQAQPVLMLHGNPTWSYFYRQPVRSLSDAGMRCIVPDHLGCGLSDKPQSGYEYTLKNRIDNVQSLVEKLDLKNICLVVHDWGGAIGLGLAGRMPERFAKITILNTGAFRFDKIPFRINLCKLPFLGKLGVQGFNMFAGPAKHMTTVTPLKKDIRNAFVFPHGNWSDRKSTYEFVRDIPMNTKHRSWPELIKVEEGLAKLKEKSIRIVWGKHDWCFHDGFLQKFKTFFPEAPVRLLEAGHYLIEDCPEQVCHELKDHFLIQK